MLHCDNPALPRPPPRAPPRHDPDIWWLDTNKAAVRAIDAPRGLLIGFGVATAVSLALAVDAGLPSWVAGVVAVAALVTVVLDWRRHADGGGRQAVVSVGIPGVSGDWALRYGDGREARVALRSVYLAHPACVCVRFTEMNCDYFMNDPADQAPSRLSRSRWQRAPSRVTYFFAGRLARPEHRALRCAVRGIVT